MLSGKDSLLVYALWQKRVAARRYLSDVPPDNLRLEELCDLIPSALYANEHLIAMPSRNNFYFMQGNGRDGILQDLIHKHRANIERLTQKQSTGAM